MQSLKKHDDKNVITLIDLQKKGFETLYPDINVSNALKILHGYYEGKLLLGLEVTHRAWTLVGKGGWVAPLNWPIFKTLFHCAYLVIAKYRHPISSIFSKVFRLKANHCNSGVCFEKSTNAYRRR